MAENSGRISRKQFGIGMRLGRTRNSGAPPAKKYRKKWYDGPPFKIKMTSKGLCPCATRYSEKKKDKGRQCHA